MATTNHELRRSQDTVKIRLPISVALGALDALKQNYDLCRNSSDEHTRVIDAAYWYADYVGLREAIKSGLKAKGIDYVDHD